MRKKEKKGEVDIINVYNVAKKELDLTPITNLSENLKIECDQK